MADKSVRKAQDKQQAAWKVHLLPGLSVLQRSAHAALHVIFEKGADVSEECVQTKERVWRGRDAQHGVKCGDIVHG